MKHFTGFALVCSIITSSLSANMLPKLYQLKDSAYRKEIYSYDQSLVGELLRKVEQVEKEQQQTYLRAVLKTFINIAKGTQFIIAQAFNDMLAYITPIFSEYMYAKKYKTYIKHNADYEIDMLSRLQTINKNILLHEFETNFNIFRTAPVDFIEGLADQLKDVAQKEIEMQQLRHTFVMFLETHLNKLIWAPEDQSETWESVKSISDNLAVLIEQNILDDLNDLDDVYWTLVHRYCQFIELTHEALDYEYFTTIKRDLAHGDTLLLELQEQDVCLEKRVECLQTTLMKAEAQKRAADYSRSDKS